MRDLGECKEAGGETYGLLLYALAESAKAVRVLEIGTGWGHSGRAFSESMKARDGAELVTIDPNNRVSVSNAIAIKASGVKWTRVESKSGDARVEGAFDILYIDGDPAQAAMDYGRFSGQVRAGGLVIFDGYGGQPVPTETVESLNIPFTCLEYHAPFCLAVHRVPVPVHAIGSNAARCANCNIVIRDDGWSTLESSVDKHVVATGHTMDVYVPSRSIKYRKGSR